MNYLTQGVQIIELTKKAYILYLEQKPSEKKKLLRILLSNCTFDSGKLYPTYNRPFDLLVKSRENDDWLRGQDVVRTFLSEAPHEIEIPTYALPA